MGSGVAEVGLSTITDVATGAWLSGVSLVSTIEATFVLVVRLAGAFSVTTSDDVATFVRTTVLPCSKNVL